MGKNMIDRRNFLKISTLMAASMPLLSVSKALASTEKKKIVVGFLQGANSVAITLIDKFLPEYDVRYQSFQDIPTITTALIKNDIQVAQNIYTGFVEMVDKKLPVVAISGQCNGGSDFVIKKELNVNENDWDDLKQKIKILKNKGENFTIASFFGSVQDIELRLLLKKQGISIKSGDVRLINVPYPGMMGALSTGAAQAAVPVQPFGVEMELEGIGKHFCFPYDQPAGNLTNLVLMSGNYVKNNGPTTNEIARAMVNLTKYLETDDGQKKWEKIVSKYSNVGSNAINLTLKQLIPSYILPSAEIFEMSQGMYESGFIKTRLTRQDILSYINYKPLESATGTNASKLGA